MFDLFEKSIDKYMFLVYLIYRTYIPNIHLEHIFIYEVIL